MTTIASSFLAAGRPVYCQNIWYKGGIWEAMASITDKIMTLAKGCRSKVKLKNNNKKDHRRVK